MKTTQIISTYINKFNIIINTFSIKEGFITTIILPNNNEIIIKKTKTPYDAIHTHTKIINNSYKPNFLQELQK